MKLSELKTGERGVIVKVSGHGAFRKRIVEMGFIHGNLVEVILNAPLKDPVKYKLMNFEVSLRRSEAETIEIVSEEEARKWANSQESLKGIEDDADKLMRKMVVEKAKIINVALVGNPNCGKTSLFNIASGAHERVGNYSGVTVDAKDGVFKQDGYTFRLIDLPGTYSLSAYSPEELYVRKYIVDSTPDIILNVVDASNIERNLYLTTQVMDMDVPIVMALNMYDELKQSGSRLNISQLAKLLGIPIVPTVGRNGEGVDNLFKEIISVYEENNKVSRHVHVNYGAVLENCIYSLRNEICKYTADFTRKISSRFMSIKLLENDNQMELMLKAMDDGNIIIDKRDRLKRIFEEENKIDIESALTDAKYGYIRGALKEVFVENTKQDCRRKTKMIDFIVTHKIWGYPIFISLMFLMFYLTFTLGAYPQDWLDSLFKWIGILIGSNMTEGPLKSLIVDGIIGGVGGVIVFVPQIMILYLCISLMEDSGYMARTAFIMDRIMHKMGLHGKSFIPMVMGFGCNIPAIMATRTIEDRKSRLITILIIPLMSCSARLPIYLILVNTFFPKHGALVLLSLYLLGIIISIIMAKVFSRFVVKGNSSPFVMELPPYRIPNALSVLRHTWAKGEQYLRKMGTVILGASILVWFLSYYPNHENYNNVMEQQENSYIGKMGKAIEPVIAPCGLDWKQGVSIITGTAAKEIVASTMGILYSGNAEEASKFKDADLDNNDTSSRLSKVLAKNMSLLSAVSLMVFVLLYMPCIPGVIAVKNESGRWKYAMFVIVYTCILAWIMSFAVFQIGTLLGLG